ncbi:MAG: carboxylating nicotinate-nucleotide diphosphorylase [Chthonomonas sp.]|nr:carboxylating nicotinate-nucleotide diphosphorylase [Chthonomonas sp.]
MTGWRHPYPADYGDALELALVEDIGTGDLTSACLPADLQVRGMIEAQAAGIACGVGIAAECLSAVADVEIKVTDGDMIESGDQVLNFEGAAVGCLSHERVALNFLMHLSGVATLTRQFVDAVQGTRARIVDTRKTIPGMRSLQKYAVRCGGGHNHRMGLYDAVMIKDNHIEACGSISRAVEKVRKSIPHTAKIEVETDRLSQVGEAINAGADIVLLDNMPHKDMAEAVQKYADKPVIFEASGGINLLTVRAVAETGVHLISVGALTHSSPALPLHLELI